MPLTDKELDSLCTRLRLGTGHETQEHTVRAALTSLLIQERRGVVLADEVGFGKTYEALAIMTLLCEQARAERKGFDRVLILCKPALLGKWHEELSRHPERGFPRYLVGETWHPRHPIFRLIGSVHVVSHRASAEEHHSIRDGGRLQAPAGIYIVNHNVLTEANRNSRFFFRRLYETEWDLVIVDEAHHYAKWTQPAYIFAPNKKMTDYDQGLSGGKFGKILALTATPFQLIAQEMSQLLALIRADQNDLVLIEKALNLYIGKLDTFFSLRQRGENDPLRRETVSILRRLRDEDALGNSTQDIGLQNLLRRYMIRNTKSQNERRYFLVNRAADKFAMQPFQKLDDLHRTIKAAPLIPFEGPDALYYLELRELIDETNEQAWAENESKTFITMDLRQGLSSYPQLAQSKLLNGDLESARRLKGLVDSWINGKALKLHPKVVALGDLIESIALAEIEKVRAAPTKWFSKVLVFNKLIGGTAPHLREVLSKRLTPIFANHLDEVLRQAGLGTRSEFSSAVRSRLRTALSDVKANIKGWREERFCLVPDEFQHEDLKDYRGRHLVDAFHTTLLRRSEQPLFLLRAAMQSGARTDDAIGRWLHAEVTGPFEQTIRRIIDSYFDGAVEEDRPHYERVDMAERECLVLMEECSSIDIVGRYDGANVRYREAHRRNFNQPLNPFVLLVSRVGEEGIDLQQQCRYVIHYDLEWNPAKMEQREGRVDRVGFGRADEGFIDVRFMLLKGTYEERIFHAVMQRDQWFQVLIGSKRKELGQEDDDDAAMKSQDIDDGPIDMPDEEGRISLDEKNAIMMDLRPRGR